MNMIFSPLRFKISETSRAGESYSGDTFRL